MMTGPEGDLSLLALVMPPPGHPFEPASDVDLNAAEHALGVQLPADYRSFIATYGSGSIGGFLHLRNPSSANRYIRLVEANAAQADVLRELRDSGEAIPYPIHPEPGGLILFTESSNGDCGYWVTDPPDDPAAWPIAVNGARDPTWYTHPGPMTRFLHDVVTRTFEAPILPDGVFNGWAYEPADIPDA